ncbi:hypothetical protein SAMN05192553_101192 [Cyclobacterium xiamenense]|uniref:Uncharacterized protein n=1 Tax=Cyclobacterium xiamenense TaxID=1297121 RepID=A0A1H6TLX3_9BACT|nr:hypothetical protein SAMN05192553_101192 [Cyclobacterium xiamenense]
MPIHLLVLSVIGHNWYENEQVGIDIPLLFIPLIKVLSLLFKQKNTYICL